MCLDSACKMSGMLHRKRVAAAAVAWDMHTFLHRGIAKAKKNIQYFHDMHITRSIHSTLAKICVLCHIQMLGRLFSSYVLKNFI